MSVYPHTIHKMSNKFLAISNDVKSLKNASFLRLCVFLSCPAPTWPSFRFLIRSTVSRASAKPCLTINPPLIKNGTIIFTDKVVRKLRFSIAAGYCHLINVNGVNRTIKFGEWYNIKNFELFLQNNKSPVFFSATIAHYNVIEFKHPHDV